MSRKAKKRKHQERKHVCCCCQENVVKKIKLLLSRKCCQENCQEKKIVKKRKMSRKEKKRKENIKKEKKKERRKKTRAPPPRCQRKKNEKKKKKCWRGWREGGGGEKKKLYLYWTALVFTMLKSSVHRSCFVTGYQHRLGFGNTGFLYHHPQCRYAGDRGSRRFGETPGLVSCARFTALIHEALKSCIREPGASLIPPCVLLNAQSSDIQKNRCSQLA